MSLRDVPNVGNGHRRSWRRFQRLAHPLRSSRGCPALQNDVASPKLPFSQAVFAQLKYPDNRYCVRYEWAKVKAASNRRLHGMDFQDTIGALKDPNRIEEADDGFDYGENRDGLQRHVGRSQLLGRTA